jgi:hypothetical protein
MTRLSRVGSCNCLCLILDQGSGRIERRTRCVSHVAEAHMLAAANATACLDRSESVNLQRG